MKSGLKTSSATDSKKKLDYFIIRGRLPGPVVMLTAGIHGTEVAGVLTARKLRAIQLARGTLIVVPLVNPRAYKCKTRGKPDLNRTFPKRSTDKPRHYISKQLFELGRKFQPDWCIDLHEADGYYNLDASKLGQTLIVYPNKKTVQTAQRVTRIVNQRIESKKKKFAVKQGELPGSFRIAAARLLKAHAVTVETSMQQPRRLRLNYQQTIVHALLREIGLL